MTFPRSSTCALARVSATSLAVSLLLAFAGIGCESSSPNRRSDPNGFFEYKRAAVRRNASKLTPAQRGLVMHHQGPNANEIDTFIDSLVQSNRRQSDAERSGIEIGESFRVQGESSPYFIEDGESSSTGFSEGEPVDD
jgi:hypothetical protein